MYVIDSKSSAEFSFVIVVADENLHKQSRGHFIQQSERMDEDKNFFL